MFQFYWPWLALLLPLPLLIRRLEAAPEVRFPSLHRLKSAFPSFQSGKNLSFLFLSLSWVFMIIALMQPEMVNQFRQIKNHGYDLMLAVDISGSMQTPDFSTTFKTVTRLDATKDVVGKFVVGRQGDRIGLITFGESAYLHVPLTLDTLAVSKMLNNTVSGMAGNATAIGDAIGLSVRTLRERPEGSRVLVLLTDGEDNASSIPPVEAAKLAKQYGIKIYTVGVGRVDFELLNEIASITGGKSFMANNKKTLESIYKKIDELEKSESNEKLFFIREPLYYYPLALSMIFLLLIPSRRIIYGS